MDEQPVNGRMNVRTNAGLDPGTVATMNPWQREATGPLTLAEVMEEVNRQGESGKAERLRPMPTGFTPLDDMLNGGLRPGELLMIGGAFGVGKTIWGLQVARNVVCADPENRAMYVCYEHDRPTSSRGSCAWRARSAAIGTTRSPCARSRICRWVGRTGMACSAGCAGSRAMPTCSMQWSSYADRLVLVKASGDHSTLEQVRRWVPTSSAAGARRLVLVVDYLQKIPVNRRRWSRRPKSPPT